jgi:hypothetical protein
MYRSEPGYHYLKAQIFADLIYRLSFARHGSTAIGSCRIHQPRGRKPPHTNNYELVNGDRDQRKSLCRDLELTDITAGEIRV